MESRKELILNEVSDIIGRLLYYDRKEDEELGLGEIEQSLIEGEVTVNDILEVIREQIVTSVEKKASSGG